MHTTINNQRIHKLENKYTKQENQHKKILKNVSRVIRK
jgi:hypothetical protein